MHHHFASSGNLDSSHRTACTPSIEISVPLRTCLTSASTTKSRHKCPPPSPTWYLSFAPVWTPHANLARSLCLQSSLSVSLAIHWNTHLINHFWQFVRESVSSAISEMSISFPVKLGKLLKKWTNDRSVVQRYDHWLERVMISCWTLS
jgi:hypothetical protein